MSPHAPALADLRLQEGIYITHGARPGRSYRLLLLDVEPDASPAAAREAIGEVWALLDELRGGHVRDLVATREGDPAIVVPHGELTCLLGLGASLFAHRAPLAPGDARPAQLLAFAPDGASPFPSLPLAERTLQPGEADLALQFIAETELAVNRAVVEVCFLIEHRSFPLKVVAVHGGFNRDDVRSWLGFLDGINNLTAKERRPAIEVVDDDPPWMKGGTYMAFLRLAIDLPAWRRLTREEQEILVGRDKLTGCPLDRVGPNGVPVAMDECPFVGDPPGSVGHLDPMRATDPRLDPRLEVSHVHRANLTRLPPGEGSHRIFRQGYEFVEVLEDGRLRVGLNFVSFQCRLDRFTGILTTPGWLAAVNFGGRARRGERAPIQLASVVAGGYYAVPPKGEPFPGAEIFR
jgi:deferrochelatase/peroxidase EfeB